MDDHALLGVEGSQSDLFAQGNCEDDSYALAPDHDDDYLSIVSIHSVESNEKQIPHDVFLFEESGKEAITETATTTETAQLAKSHQYSVANEWFVTNSVVLFSLDMEHGGPVAGILQLSCIAFCPDGNELGKFDKFILPVKNSIISQESSKIHGISLNSLHLKNAQPLKIVWKAFVEFIESFLDGGKKQGVIIAWNGKSCDLEWLFFITKDGNKNNLSMPQWCPFSWILKLLSQITQAANLTANIQHLIAMGWRLFGAMQCNRKNYLMHIILLLTVKHKWTLYFMGTLGAI